MSYAGDDGKPPKSPYTAEELSNLTDGNQADPIDRRKFQQERNLSSWHRVGNKVAEIAVQRSERLAAKEATFGKNPWAAALIAAHEGYLFSKEVYQYIQEERALAKAAEQAASKEKLPFFKIEEQSAGVGTLRHDPKRGTTSLVVHEDQIERIIQDTSNKYNYVFTNIQIYKPSLEAKVSKTGSEHIWQAKEKELIAEAAQGAADFRKNYLIGTAQEKYQFYLNTTLKELGHDYLDRVNHPDRVLRFEQFTAERIYVDGYTPSEIGSIYREKSPFMTGVNDEKYLEKIGQRILKQEPELEQSRKALADWRLSRGIAETDRRSPSEYEISEQVRKEINRYRQEYEHLQLQKAQHFYQEYLKTSELQTTTKQEYILELARMNRQGETLSQNETEIVVKLIAAGHKRDDIIAALQEASPYAYESGYGEKLYKKTAELFDSNPKLKEWVTDIDKMKARHNVIDETRLDRLGLAHEQPGRGEYLGQGFTKPTDPHSIEQYDRSFDQLETYKGYEFGR